MLNGADEAVLGAVLGHVAHAEVDHLAGAGPGDVVAVDLHRAGRLGAHPHQGLDELALAVALHAGDAEDLPGPHLEVEAVDRGGAAVVGDGEVPHPQDRGARACSAPSRRRSCTSRPTMSVARLCDGGVRGVGLAHDLAAAGAPRSRSATASTSRSLWVMKMIDLPAATRLRMTVEEVVDLAGGEHRGGLVEDQDLRVAEQRLDQLDALLLADGQVADLRVGIDLEPVALGQLDDPGPGGAQVEERAPSQLVAQHDVLGDREHRDELEVLVHHPDALGDGVGGAAEPHRLAPHEDLAGVGLVQPEHGVHQGALAGPVLAEEAEHLALVEGEVDVVVGDDAGERLGDAPHLEDRRRSRCGGRRLGQAWLPGERQAGGGVEARLDAAVGQALAGLLQLGGDVVGDVGVVERGVGDAAVRGREAVDPAVEACRRGWRRSR